MAALPWETSGEEIATNKLPWEKEVVRPQPVDTKEPEQLTSANLTSNQEWLNASRTVYNTGKPEVSHWTGTDEELAEWGLDHMGYFNWNLTKMAYDSRQLNNASQDVKDSFLYLMETYDEIDQPLGDNAWRVAKGIASDPFTYLGITTLGAGLAAKQATKIATKEGIKGMLKVGAVRTGGLAAGEGAIYGGTDASIREGVRVKAGVKDEKDLGTIVKGAAIGAAAGITLGTTLDVAGQAIAKKIKAKEKQAKELAQKPLKEAQAKAKELEAEVVELKKELDLNTAKVADEAPEVEVPATNQLAAEIIDDMEVDIPYFNTALTQPLRNKAEILARSNELVENLMEIGSDRFRVVVSKIKASSMTPETRGNVAKAAQVYRDAYFRKMVDLDDSLNDALAGGNAQLAVEIQKKKDDLRSIVDIADDLDSSIASESAAQTGQRNDPQGLATGVGYSTAALKALPENAKLDDEGIAKLQDVLIREAIEKADAGKIEKEYKVKLDQQLKSGDYAGYLKTKSEMEFEKQARIDAKTKSFKKTVAKNAGEVYLDISQKTIELTTSNIFSGSTLILNATASTMKTLYRPAVDFAVGFDYGKQARVELFHQYAQLKAIKSTALQLARANFKYEKQIATFESNKLLEAPSKIKGITGSVVRTIPKLMLWTDGLLQDINYRTYVASRASVQAYDNSQLIIKAYDKALKKKVKTDELDAFLKEELGSIAVSGKAAKKIKDNGVDDYINKKVNREVNKSYDTEIVDNTIKAVYEKGAVKGYKGDELHAWVQKSIKKDKDILKTYNDSDGIKYSNDMLFKNPFSGKGTASKALKGYEGFLQRHPLFKLVTNQFLRTPVRVLEEGVRLTPALQLASKNFRKDLLGENGRKAQLRARGEFLISQAMMAEAILLYSEGNLTGAEHPTNPYSIKVNGEWYSYRLFDPFSTPVKMIANAFDRYNLEQLRHYQQGGGDTTFSDELNMVMSSAAVGMFLSIRDANLVTGFVQTGEFLFDSAEQALNDPSAYDKPLLDQFLLKKTEMFLPKQPYKIYAMEDPTFYSPVDINQTLTKMGLPYAEIAHPLLQPLGIDLDVDKMRNSVPKRYSPLGIPERHANPLAWNLMFVPTSEEDHYKGYNEDQIFVDKALNALERAVGAKEYTLRIPFKKRDVFGSVDLRTMYTTANDKYPRETYFDRWNRIYLELGVEKQLRPVLASGIPEGIPKNSPMLDTVRSIITMNKNAAWALLMSQEQPVLQQTITNIKDDAIITTGQRDVDSTLFQP